jgi:hypothetical protein
VQFTLADVTRITGAKRRSVQLWAEAGALRAVASSERAGSGVHRLFGREEVVIACILQGFALQGVSIGNLIQVADGLRVYFSIPHLRETFDEALRGVGTNIMLYDLRGHINIWSSTHSKVSLDSALTSMMGEQSISAVCVDINASVARAGFRLTD